MKVLIILIVLVCFSAAPGLSQEELLPEGAYGTTIHGGIEARERKDFYFDGDEGQIFKASLLTRGVEKGATLQLLDSLGTSVLGDLAKVGNIDALNFVIPKKERYQLRISAGETACSYVLEVTLDDAPPEPAPTTPKVR